MSHLRPTILASLAFAATGASAGNLYGIGFDPTNPFSPTATFYNIDEASALCTPLFSFGVPALHFVSRLAYHPGTGHFYAIATNFTAFYSSRLVDIDPAAQTATYVSMTSNLNLEGLDYYASLGSLVVSYSPNNAFTNTIAPITPGGVMGASATIPTTDTDTLGVDPVTGEMLAYDASNPTAGFSLNRVQNPFGSPTVTGLYGGPADPVNDWDVASYGGSLYLGHATDLIKFAPGLGTRSTVGTFFIGQQEMRGIAAGPVPEPSALLALGLGAASLMRRRVS